MPACIEFLQSLQHWHNVRLGCSPRVATDINECEQNTDGCEQDCTNFDGGYNCTCGSQYALATDLHNCLGKPFHMHALLCLVNHAGCFKFPLERGKLPF